MSGQERGGCGRELSVGYSIEFQVSSLYVSVCMFQRDGSLGVLWNWATCIFCCVISSTGRLFVQMPWLTFSVGLILPRSATQFTLCVWGCLFVCWWVGRLSHSFNGHISGKAFVHDCMYVYLFVHTCIVFYLLFVHVCLTSGSATILFYLNGDKMWATTTVV